MLYDIYKKIKSWLEINQKDLFLAAIIILVSIINFGLGRLSVIWPEKQSVTIENVEGGMWKVDNGKNNTNYQNVPNVPPSTINSPPSQSKYVASKNSTFYHYPWCPGALRIKEENKIWFQTKEEAESRGYKPAGNCDGL